MCKFSGAIEGQCSAVDRFLGRSVISFIPNSFNNTFVWQDAIRKRAEVRERRVRRPARESKESFAIGQQVLLQDHVSKKWDIPGEITNVRLAPDNKILSYEIRTNNGNLTTRHRSMIKRTPNINNEANIPVIVDNPSAPGDDTAIPEPAETWSRGGGLRATH